MFEYILQYIVNLSFNQRNFLEHINQYLLQIQQVLGLRNYYCYFYFYFIFKILRYAKSM